MQLQRAMSFVLGALVLVSASAFHPQVGLANFITNGDFEADPFLSGWYRSGDPATPQTGSHAIGGAGTSVLLTNPSGNARGTLGQVFADNTGPNWAVGWDFACETTSAQRSMQGVLWADDGRVALQFYVGSDGKWMFNHPTNGGTNFVPLEDLTGSVLFDDDVTESPLTHHVKIIGNMHLLEPTFDVIVTDSDNNVHEALGATLWRHTPRTGAGLSEIRFDARDPGSLRFLVDNVRAVPEPSALILLACALVGLLGLPRRRSR